MRVSECVLQYHTVPSQAHRPVPSRGGLPELGVHCCAALRGAGRALGNGLYRRQPCTSSCSGAARGCLPSVAPRSVHPVNGLYRGGVRLDITLQPPVRIPVAVSDFKSKVISLCSSSLTFCMEHGILVCCLLGLGGPLRLRVGFRCMRSGWSECGVVCLHRLHSGTSPPLLRAVSLGMVCPRRVLGVSVIMVPTLAADDGLILLRRGGGAEWCRCSAGC